MTDNHAPHKYWAVLLLGGAFIGLGAAVSTQTLKNRQQTMETARLLTRGGDPSNAPEIFRQYGCAGCHTIPGVAGADGKVGGDLSGLRGRVYIAGVANNTPDNLIRWIVSPRMLSPKTAMPETGISEAEARDLAAYLYAR